jgi:magnesium chelatase family protein
VLASLRSAAVFGVEAFPVHVEVDVAFGLPHFSMVGLPDATVKESRDRVRSAIRNSGFEFPHHRITVNLAPADVRKAGSSFDLPIALGLLATSGPLTRRCVDDTVIVGELSLDGAINGIRGVLPIAVGARRLGLKRLLLPPQNATEASVVEGLDICVANSLAEAVEALNEPERAKRATTGPVSTSRLTPADSDLADVRGQLLARQPADDRPTRCRQDDAGETIGNDSATPHVR